jgi:hypothetical protein
MAILDSSHTKGTKMRTIGEIAGELYNIIDNEGDSHGLWDEAFSEAQRRDGLSPFDLDQLRQ